MAHDIFISYAHEDKLLADALCATLESRKLRCWIAPRDVQPGNWAASIVEAIEASRALVLVFSSRSNVSQHVQREVERAASKSLIIVPVRVQDVPLSKEMEYFIGNQHWLDALSPPIEKQFLGVAEKLEGWLSKNTGSPPVDVAGARNIPVHVKAPGSKLYKYAAVAVALTLVIAIVAVVARMKSGPPPSAPVFTEQPRDREAKDGSTAEFTGVVEGSGVSYQWEFSTNQEQWVAIRGATALKLHLSKAGSADIGEYRLIAKNGGGAVTSSPSTLVVTSLRAPEVVRQPAGLDVSAGAEAVIDAEVSGDDRLGFIWEFKGTNSDAWARVAGAASARLDIARVKYTDAGSYRLTVKNQQGSVTSAEAELKVHLPRPSLLVQLQRSQALAQFHQADMSQLVDKVQQQLLQDGRFDVIVDAPNASHSTAPPGMSYKIILAVDQFESQVLDISPRGGSSPNVQFNFRGPGGFGTVSPGQSAPQPSMFQPRINYRISWQMLRGTSLVKSDTVSGTGIGMQFQVPREQNMSLAGAQRYVAENNLAPVSDAVEKASGDIAKEILGITLPN